MKTLISGKVREVYEADAEHLVIVTTDRISAFDVILPTMIPQKGVALNLISNHWFGFTKDIVPNHIVSTELADMPEQFRADPAAYDKRIIKVNRLKMLPYEFIVRGYMFGSMWKEYSASGTFCGRPVAGTYRQAEKLAEPMLTPSSKSTEGHDENITIERLYNELGADTGKRVGEICLKLFDACYTEALKRGIIIADTKFEFGYDKNGVLTIGDEMFTPDSSRFWDAAEYRVGESPKSYDKQFVRDWLIAKKLDGVTPAPELPEDVRRRTAEIYKECYQKITGRAEY